MRETEVPLGRPPVVVNMGVGVHGVVSPTDVFRLPRLWQLHLYRYDAELTVEGTTHLVRPGRVSLVPPGATVHYRYQGRSEHLYAHLLIEAAGVPHRIPVIQDTGPDFPLLADLLSRAIAAFPSRPDHTRAEIWTALWRITALAPAPDRDRHPAVAAAIAHIEAHLATSLVVPDIARTVGVSHNHLTRLFRSETGNTVVAHIRKRRMQRARHLLSASTLSIPAIAASVGIPDLQAFNKACRRELGAAPRVLRGPGTPATPRTPVTAGRGTAAERSSGASGS
ncbi:helix-turn-helix transcriptional regulator [Streptomyces sp. NPDC090106]|uniref:helix-turn-helix transcriptional regulator n=1 Tax=Streptomyces sp. NPDC090106 TaxID=3365946 RepID=UPI00380911AE